MDIIILNKLNKQGVRIDNMILVSTMNSKNIRRWLDFMKIRRVQKGERMKGV